MVALLAAALFSTIAVLATALYALLSQLNSFRSDVSARFDGLTADVAEVRVGLSRVEQKLDDHLGSPHPAH